MLWLICVYDWPFFTCGVECPPCGKQNTAHQVSGNVLLHLCIAHFSCQKKCWYSKFKKCHVCSVHYNLMFIKISKCGKMHKMSLAIFTYKKWLDSFCFLTYYWNLPFYLWISHSHVIGLDFRQNMVLEIMCFLMCEYHIFIFKMWKEDDATCKQITFSCIDYMCWYVVGLHIRNSLCGECFLCMIHSIFRFKACLLF